MIKQINTEAIVIKKINYKESDKIITLFTKDLGKIDCIARSVRSAKSKKQSHLDLFNVLDAQIINGKTWHIIGQTNILETFTKLKKDYISIEKAYLIAEIVNLITPNSEKNTTYYEFIKKTIETLEMNPSVTLINAFLLKIIHINGFYDKSRYNNKEKIEGYLNILLKTKYDDISDIDDNKAISTITYNYLIGEIENILEKRLKCKFTI